MSANFTLSAARDPGVNLKELKLLVKHIWHDFCGGGCSAEIKKTEVPTMLRITSFVMLRITSLVMIAGIAFALGQIWIEMVV